MYWSDDDGDWHKNPIAHVGTRPSRGALEASGPQLRGGPPSSELAALAAKLAAKIRAEEERVRTRSERADVPGRFRVRLQCSVT